MEKKVKYKVGDWVRLKSSGTSVGGFIGDVNVGSVKQILHMNAHGGNATEQDPRYYGTGWNVRACDLEFVSFGSGSSIEVVIFQIKKEIGI